MLHHLRSHLQVFAAMSAALVVSNSQMAVAQDYYQGSAGTPAPIAVQDPSQSILVPAENPENRAVPILQSSQLDGLNIVDQDKERQDKLAALNKKVASAHKPLFFDNDFSYLCDENYNGFELGDGLKMRALPGGGNYDIGGQFRTRAHFERNIRGSGLTGVDDKFLLRRTRVYGDFRISPDVRFFAEMIDAESNEENFAPRGIEVNRYDMQNLFVEARLLAGPNGSLSARVGRQELLFGAQRAISPLDWANTRRTFEGARIMWSNENRSVDAFWTNPMRVDDNSFDSPDRDQEFMGVYSSYTGCADQTIDHYFLRHLNGRGANDFEYNTIGTRWQGSRCNLLYDFESAYQFGDNTDGSDHVAGMATFGLGRKYTNRCWQPTLWMYYDWASGDDATGAGNGFHHSFPLAHKYNGFMDLYGRRNLEDINLQLSVQPTERLKLLAWYHYLFLETQTDTPYLVNMAAFNGGNAPGGADLGHEIDFIADYKVGARQNLVLGYSHFFSGGYYANTAGVPFNGDADFFYTQWTVNF